MSLINVAIGLSAILAASPAFAEPLWCGWQTKNQCGPGAPCKPIEANEMFAIIDTAKNTYSRCDDKNGCTAYTMVQSGDYEHYRTFELPGRGSFVKLGPKGDASEVVSLASMVLVSYGHCFPQSQLKK